jgi:hypothetical protein
LTVRLTPDPLALRAGATVHVFDYGFQLGIRLKARALVEVLHQS